MTGYGKVFSGADIMSHVVYPVKQDRWPSKQGLPTVCIRGAVRRSILAEQAINKLVSIQWSKCTTVVIARDIF